MSLFKSLIRLIGEVWANHRRITKPQLNNERLELYTENGL